jgi:hypothetical protein
MPWTNVEERLGRVFSIRISFPSGVLALPSERLNIDEWLTTAAETDEELRELDIPRIRFLQNRWEIDEIVEFTWETELSITRRSLWGMYVGRRAYILFSGGFKYHLIAAVEPRDAPELYEVVLRRLMQDHDLLPVPPTHTMIRRPDLVPELERIFRDAVQPVSTPFVNHYLANLLVGWIGHWIDVPVFGYWHEDTAESIGTTDKGGSHAIHPNVWRQTAGKAETEKTRDAR